MTSRAFYAEIADFADRLAAASAEITLPLFRTPLLTDNKAEQGTFDPVTIADRNAEAAMRSMIRKAYPNHGILGEEFEDEAPNADYLWVLDPIDGTRAFISGLPLWGTLIGLTYLGKPVFGMMHQPFTGESFTGTTFETEVGNALLRRENSCISLRTSSRMALSEATISTTSPRIFTDSERTAYDRVEQACRLARYGYDCYAYAMVAAGHIDLVIEAGLKAFDIVPLVPIIEAAGGVVSNWAGAPITEGGTAIAAATPQLHEAALALLNA